MKKTMSVFILILAFAILYPIQLLAASIEISWEANTESDLAGYKIYYGTQSGTYKSVLNAGNTTTASLDSLETGTTYYFVITAYDNSGNESDYSDEVSIYIPVPDTTPPTGTISINAGASVASSRTVTLSLTATDETGTISAMKISNDGTTWSSEAAFSSSQAWVLSEGDGIKTVYVMFEDNSGNWMTAPVSDTIQLVLDSDDDGMPDTWESANGLDPNDASDAGLDSDNDGYNNMEEYANNTNPNYRYDFAPTVDAGDDQQSDPTRIYLSGSASDPNGDSLAYAWTQVSGPASVAIEDAQSASANFLGVKSGTYRFMLTCSDDRSSTSDTTDVVINNLAPTVDAGGDMTINSGQSVELHSTGADANGDTLTYSWTLAEGPSISLPAMNTQDITVTPKSGGTYRFSVICSDGVNSSVADEVILTVNAVNNAPTANAGSDIDTQAGSVVKLDGTGSSDPDGDTLSYAWTQVSGTTVTLSGAAAAQPEFTAAATGEYVFELTVSDGTVSSTPDTVTVQVLRQNNSPVASAGDDVTTTAGSTVVLDASSSYDPDDDAISYKWTQTGGASVEIAGAETSRISFTPTVSGVLEFKVAVSDGQAQNEDTVSVTVQSVNTVPVAEAGDAQTVTSGQTVTLNGGNSHDADNDTLSYIWSQTAGQSVSLTNPNTASPSFTPTAAGLYTFELKVYDGKDTSVADAVSVTVQAAQTALELKSPANGTEVSENPVFKWNGFNLGRYYLYVALDGKNYVNTYTGNSKIFSLHPALWYWFIPSKTKISWYVVSIGSGKQTSSIAYTFTKK